MLLRDMASEFSRFKQNVNIGQFCITFMRIITLWLCAKLGIALLPTGCRPIPAGHYNFDPALAREFGGRDGVNRAIIYQYIANWVIYNQEHGKNYVDGRFWSYNSGPAWAEMIKLWEPNTVEKHIRFLREEGVLDAKAMKADKGIQTLWYSLPQKESYGGTQIALPLDSNAGVGGAKESNDSSISQQAISSSTVSKPQQQQQPRAQSHARAHTDAGGVAQFPKRDLDPKEGFEFPKAELPEARDLKESQDGGQHDPPPLSAPPSPVVPDWMPEFFTGCAESELVQLLHEFGEPLLLSARKYAEDADHHVSNPPGFVRVQLARGWRPPVGSRGKSYLQGWMINGSDDLADETIERLQWIISDECDWLPMHKTLARDELAARQAGVK